MEKLLSRGYIDSGYLLGNYRRSYENVSGARRDDLKDRGASNRLDRRTEVYSDDSGDC